MNEKEIIHYYEIPANYTDSGRLFGGMVAVRNAIEALIITVMLGFVELTLIPMSTIVRIVVMVLTIMPSAVVAMMGVDGESLSQYLGHIFKFLKNKRKLHYIRKEKETDGKIEKEDTVGTNLYTY